MTPSTKMAWSFLRHAAISDTMLSSISRSSMTLAPHSGTLDLCVTASGDAIELDCGTIDSDNLLAYIVELLDLVSQLPVNGIVTLHRSPDSSAEVCAVFSGRLASVIGCTVQIQKSFQPSVSSALPANASAATTSGKPIAPINDERTIFDPRRPRGDLSRVAKRGDRIRHRIEFTPPLGKARPATFQLDLEPNERLLGTDGQAFFQPVLINNDNPDADAIRLSIMHGDGMDTADLAKMLGIHVAAVDLPAKSGNFQRLFVRLAADDLMRAFGEAASLRVVLFTQVIRGRVDLTSVAPPYRSLTTRQSGGINRKRPAGVWRFDPPHRSQASRPVNYAADLQHRYGQSRRVNRLARRTGAALPG